MTAAELLRTDFGLIADLVPEGARVLDLGCGDGRLLELLRERKSARVAGIELSSEDVAACIARGLTVVQADLDRGLPHFADDAFDVVVLSQTLQVVRQPLPLLREMLRVGRLAVVSFPNFGHWRVRGPLALTGRMPVSPALPYQWYDTPNIHHTTLKDFRAFVRAAGGRVERELALAGRAGEPSRVVRVLPNLRGETGLFVVRRSGER